MGLMHYCIVVLLPCSHVSCFPVLYATMIDIEYSAMFRQFLQLDLSHPHDKQSYCLKKNELVLKSLSQSIKFDAICYSSDDIASKIILELVTLASKPHQSLTLTATFNYNLPAKDLLMIVEKITEVKIFAKGRFRLGHFQIRNGHISDYNKSTNRKDSAMIDDLDQFDKQIDNWLKLQRLWKINEYLNYQGLTSANINQEITNSGRKFGKRTNQFFIIEINQTLKLILIILPRSRELVFTREQEKEIEELYIINKHSHTQQQHICFNTPIAQIINNYLQNSSVNVFVSCFPQEGKELTEAMKLSLRLGNPHEKEIKEILEKYNEHKWEELQRETERMRKRLKDLQYSVKAEQDNMQRLIKIYSKSFSKSFTSIDYLKLKEVTNIHTYTDWLKAQIRLKEQEIGSEQAALKELHKQMIKNEERHLFYVNKIKKYKENVVIPSSQTTPNTLASKQVSTHHDNDNFEPTEQELMYFYDPQKEINRYREMKQEELKNKLSTAGEKKSFTKLIEQAKFKISKLDFNKLQQEFYDLISS